MNNRTPEHTPCRRQPRQSIAAADRTTRNAAPHKRRTTSRLEIVRRFEPDLECQLQALALLLGIRLMPPLVTAREDLMGQAEKCRPPRFGARVEGQQSNGRGYQLQQPPTACRATRWQSNEYQVCTLASHMDCEV